MALRVASVLRAACLVCPVLLMPGCASLRPFQEETKAIVRIGTVVNEEIPVDSVASYFAPYAILAQATYFNGYYGLRNFGAFDDNEDSSEALIQDIAAEPPEQAGRPKLGENKVRAWVDQWQLLDQRINESERAVPARQDFACLVPRAGVPAPLRAIAVKLRTQEQCDGLRVLDGLGVQVWVRKSDPCREIVIAFRGTDFTQSDDWLSNLRWLTRALPLYDQYEQVQDHIHDIVTAAKRRACGTRQPGRIVAVGHSLGGGLAQQAAYVHGEIDRVYAFDPSFVTGFYDKHILNAPQNAKGLTTDRIYEHGEILSYPRLLMRHLYPPAPCDPLIRHVRVQAADNGSPVRQHSMSLLAGHMLVNSPDRPPANVQKEVNLPPSPLAIGNTAACREPQAMGYVAQGPQEAGPARPVRRQVIVTVSAR